MFEKIQSTLKSREFQTGAGQIAITVTSIIVANVVSGLVAKGLNTGLTTLMDKVHGQVVETPVSE